MNAPTVRFAPCRLPNTEIQALVIHRNADVARGLAMLLGSERGIAIAASATNLQHGAHWARIKQPDVVVLDAHLPHIATEWSIESLREAAPAARFVLVTSGILEATASPCHAQTAGLEVVKATDPIEALVDAVRRTRFPGHAAAAHYARSAA